MSEQATEALDNVEQTLVVVEKHISLFKKTSLEEYVAHLSPLERAMVQVSLAYTINALLFVFLKTQGVSPKDIRHTHVKQELERVKAFVKKIKDAKELAKGPKLVLDAKASKRFIHNALSADQVYVDAFKSTKGHQHNTEAQKQAGSKAKRTPTNLSRSKNKRQRNY